MVSKSAQRLKQGSDFEVRRRGCLCRHGPFLRAQSGLIPGTFLQFVPLVLGSIKTTVIKSADCWVQQGRPSNPATQKAEAGGSEMQGLPRLQSEFKASPGNLLVSKVKKVKVRMLAKYRQDTELGP